MSYTHSDHWKRGLHAAKNRETVAEQLVQVKKGPLVYCARIVEAYSIPDGPDCWTVIAHMPENARFTVPVSRVWLCGDEKCLCTPAPCEAVGGPGEGQAAGAPAGIAGVCQHRPEGFTCL